MNAIKKSQKLFATASFCILLSPALQAQSKLPSGVAAIVNGTSISENLVESAVKANLARNSKITPEEIRPIIKEEFINRELLAQEANDKKLDRSTEAQAEFAQIKQTFLVELALKNNLIKNPVTESDIKNEYEVLLKNTGDPTNLFEYKIRHIVLANQAEANAVLARLKKGDNFEKLAKEKSIDRNKNNGGDLGWVLPNQILPAIGNVLPNLNKGSLAAAPIQSPLGWHIIKLEDKRNFKIPTIEQIKDQIQQSLIQKRQAEFIKKLKENAKIIQ